MGYHVQVVNTTNLADAIENHPTMKGISVDIRSEFINMNSKKQKKKQDQKNPTKTNTKILQIYVAWDSTATARRILTKIYSSAAKGQYPLGTQARFIPGNQDLRFIRTKESSLAYMNLLKKHIQFMKSTKVQSSHNIIELDYYLDKVKMSTHRILVTELISHFESSWKKKHST